MVRPFRPVVFEGFGTGALVDAPMCCLIGYVRQHAFGILQVRHLSFRRGFSRREQIVQKLAQLAIAGYVAAKDQSSVLVDDEQRVGPGSVCAMNPAVEMIDENREPHVFEPV